MKAIYMLFITLTLVFHGVHSAIISGSKRMPAVAKGFCECGVFGQANATFENEEPVLRHQLMKVSCNKNGELICTETCANLAKANKEEGPAKICTSVQHIDDLMPAVYARTCAQPKWVYSGVHCPEKICCHEGKAVPCKNANATKEEEPVVHDEPQEANTTKADAETTEIVLEAEKTDVKTENKEELETKTEKPEESTIQRDNRLPNL